MKRNSFLRGVIGWVVFIFSGFPLFAQPITLRFWDFPHLPETNKYLAHAIADFETSHPGVKIEYTRLPWQDGQQKIFLSVLAGNPPDVAGQVSNNLSGFITQGVLEPFDEVIADELHDYHQSYIDAVSYKNRIYAVPWYKACYVMLMNLEVFAAAGVEPPVDGRWTWDEFISKMEACTTTVAATRGQPERKMYGIATNMGPGEYEAYSIIFNFGGRILQQQADGTMRSALDQPDFINGLKALQSLEFEHGVAVPGIGGATQEQSYSIWRDSRNVACTIQGGWCVGALRIGNEEIERTNQELARQGLTDQLRKPYQWAIASIPTKDAVTAPVLASSGLGTFVVFKQPDARRRKLAQDFAQYIVRNGQQVLKYECVYPSRISAGNPYAGDAMLENVFAMFPDAVQSLLFPGGERIDKVLQQEIQRALLKDPKTGEPLTSAEAASGAAHRKVESVIERSERRFGR